MPKGHIGKDGRVVYACVNYRSNSNCFQMPGACYPHKGQIIADLYDENGQFHRSAVVADLGKTSLAQIQKYVDERNAKTVDN